MVIRVAIEDLGGWSAAARVLAEYDPLERTIRVNRRCVETLSESYGPEAAQAFVSCAIAHELFHAGSTRGGEAAAHAFAERLTGIDPHRFEAMLRQIAC